MTKSKTGHWFLFQKNLSRMHWEVVDYVADLPLQIEVLGSFLNGGY